MMISKSSLSEAAIDYLKGVSKMLVAQLGRNPRSVQRSRWMVKISATKTSGKEFTREVFDKLNASILYQSKCLHADLTQQQKLIDILVGAGIDRDQTYYGFLFPLVHNWLDLEDPFTFNEEQLGRVLDEFCTAVIDNMVYYESRSVLLPLDLSAQPLSLGKEVTLRPINVNELWELGEIEEFRQWRPSPSHIFHFVSEDWKILEIKKQQTREQARSANVTQDIREAVFIALALVSPGHLQLYDLGTKANYGMGAIGTVIVGSSMPVEIGRGSGKYVLDNNVARQLKDLWPNLKRIIESEHHYLRIPARRLTDGGGRFRSDDAIIDYSIGLESLLLKGVSAELSYRFAIRGATILAWEGGDKKKFFKQLLEFYKVRSKIVHGGHVDPSKLGDVQSTGERILRAIWWWCYNNKEDLSRTLNKVDKAILE